MSNTKINLDDVRNDVNKIADAIGGKPSNSAGEVLLWITLYEPIPAAPTVFTDWLIALDLDGDRATGRPAGAAADDGHAHLGRAFARLTHARTLLGACTEEGEQDATLG